MNKDMYFVGLQIILFALFVFSPSLANFETPKLLKIIGGSLVFLGIVIVLVSILQLNKNLSPFPTPKKDSQLITSGLYALVRHPIYFGILILFFGYTLYNVSISKLLITFSLGILFHYKSKYEEELLLIKFEEYKLYQKYTYKIFPFI